MEAGQITKVYQNETNHHFNQKAIVNGGRVRIFNISQNGLLIELSPHLKDGDKVDIYCEFQGQEIRVSGVIVHTIIRRCHRVKLVHTLDSRLQIFNLLNSLGQLEKKVREGA